MLPLIRDIWGDIWKHTVKESQINATSVNMHPFIRAILGDIWKHTYSGVIHLPMQPIWGLIQRHMVDKKLTNVFNVVVHPPMQPIWTSIWSHTLGKGKTNATSVTLHLLRRVIWEDIWKHTAEKRQTSAVSVTLYLLRQATWGDIWNHYASSNTGHLRRHMKTQWRKIKQMQSVSLCILWSKWLEETFQNAERRKAE